MSNLSLYKVVDPRIDFSESPIYTIPESASQIIYRQYPSTTFSNNNIQMQITLDRKYAISSKMYMNVGFRVVITGVPAPGTSLIQIGQDAPRFMPLTSITQVLEVALANQSFTQKINYYHDALMRYGNNLGEVSDDLSTFPSMFDSYQNYSDFLNYGSGLNALGRIGEGAQGAIQPRGGYPYTIVSGNGIDETIAVVEFRTYEPIIISPLVWGHYNHKSFRNVPNISVNYTFQTDLSRVWSRSYASGATNVNIDVSIIGVNGIGSGSSPILEIITQTPKLYQGINPIQKYAYSEIQPYTQVISPSLNFNESTTVNANNMTLSGVPSKIYIFARRSDKERTAFTTDTYARINSINMIFGNVDGIFTQCSPQQLYSISVQNGYLGSFSDWYKYSGSVFCMDFGKDVPVKEDEAAGLQENIQLQYTLSLTSLAEHDNYNPAVDQSISYTLYTIVVYDGLVSIMEDGMIMKERNILTKNSISNSSVVQKLPYHAITNFSVTGGSFGSKLRAISSGAVKLAKKGKNIYSNLPGPVKDLLKQGTEAGLDLISPRIMEVARDIGPIAKDVVKGLQGSGYTEQQIYNKLVKMRNNQGSGLYGGKKLTKAQLKKLKY